MLVADAAADGHPDDMGVAPDAVDLVKRCLDVGHGKRREREEATVVLPAELHIEVVSEGPQSAALLAVDR